MKFLKKIKDKIYYILVEKNSVIKDKYQNYVNEDPQYHKKHRFRSWFYMLSLNLTYGERKNVAPVQLESAPTPDKTATTKPAKLPYLEGSESELFLRQKPHYKCNQLMEYDIISFDIFDTLIVRPFANPTDLFIILGIELNINNFYELRKNAEKRAREIKKALYNNSEINIYDIYEIISKQTGLDKNIGAQAEFELEMKFSKPQIYNKRLYNILLSQGKTLIACSDMYLPKKFILELLYKNGYKGFDDVFVSCEHSVSKRSGGLYKIIENKYGYDKKYFHTGDNYSVDIVAAKDSGWNTLFSKNCNIAGNNYRAPEMTPLIGSAYAGIVNSHLHNGLRCFSPQYEFGFIYGGIYILGFCNWIHQQCENSNIKKVLFLARDGYILQKAYNFMFPNFETEYVYWSRIAGQKYAAKSDLNDFITKMVIHKSRNKNINSSVGQLLKILDIKNLSIKLQYYGLSTYSILDESTVESVKEFLLNNLEEINYRFKEHKGFLARQFEEYIGNHKKIAVVDVGWIGSGPLGVKYLIEEEWGFDCGVQCLTAGCRHYGEHGSLPSIINETVKSYLFSEINNTETYNYHSKTNRNSNNIFFEIFTQATEPSFRGLTDDFCCEFDFVEIENYQAITEVHNGILDFIKIYNDMFLHNKFMFNIPPSDAYAPFKHITRDVKFIKNVFSNFTYSRTIGSDLENQSIEILGNMISDLKL